jgi:opacity protein-like surface antigen
MRPIALLSLLASVAFASTAIAADAPSRTKEPSLLMKAPAANWSGFYVGRVLGGGWSQAKSSQAGSKSYTMSGTTGGTVFGYNWQSDAWIYGLEGEISINEIKGKTAGAAGVVGHSGDNLFTASLRGRLGYDLGRFMPYVTAGVALSQLHQHNWPGTFYQGDVKSQEGVTAGVGLDAKIWGPITGRIEYAYAHFGSKNFDLAAGNVVRTSMDNHFIRAGLIWRERDGSLKASKAAASGMVDWSGRYAGLLIGGRQSKANTTDGIASTNLEGSGATFGLYGGYNWMFGNVLLGLDSDISLAAVSGDKGITGLPAMSYSEMWNAQGRVRLGYAMGAFLPYVAGGISYGQFEQQEAASGSTAVEPIHAWTVGAGLDYRIMSSVSARAEYVYARAFDKANPGLNAIRYTTDHESHTVRAGLAYHFQ